MNIELLERIANHIQEEPRRFTMATWVATNRGPAGDAPIEVAYAPPCGTAACLAGWAVLLGDKQPPGAAHFGDIPSRARDLLGITFGESENLFFDYNWPEDIYHEYRQGCKMIEDGFENNNPESITNGLRIKAAAAVARIQRFIQKGI